MKKRFKQEKYIRQRVLSNGLTSFQVYIPYEDLQGVRKWYAKTFKPNLYISEKEAFTQAKIHRDDILYSIRTKTFNLQQLPTVEQVFKQSLTILNSSYKTIHTLQSAFNKHLQDIKDLQCDKLTILIIQNKINNLATTCSESIFKQLLNILRKIVNTSLQLNYINVDVMKSVVIPKCKVPNKARKIKITTDTIFKIIDKLRSEKTYKATTYANVIEVCYYLGARPSEVLALRKQNIDFKNNVIHITTSLKLNKQGELVASTLKTKFSDRYLPIVNELKLLLTTLYNKANDYLFLTEQGAFVNSNDIWHYVHRGYPNIPFNMYMLRHKMSSDLVSSGTDVRTIQEILGHSNANMSIQYAYSNDEVKRDVLNKR